MQTGQYGFTTDNVEHGKAALLLYAMYKSRDPASSLNGLETWNRFTAYIRGACLKSSTTAEFVNQFCRMARIASIKPGYLTVDGMAVMPSGEIIQSAGVKDYQLDILADDTLLRILEKEGMYLTMLVRERIQREKLEGTDHDEDDEG